jgi:hypothetical protein
MGNGLLQSLPRLPSVQIADALRSGMAGRLELVAGSSHLGGAQFHADTIATF